MADPTLMPWPGTDDDNQTDRFWSDGSYAAWAFDDGSWQVFRPGGGAFLEGSVFARSSGWSIDSSAPTVMAPTAIDGEGIARQIEETMRSGMAAGRSGADEALARLLAETSSEVDHG